MAEPGRIDADAYEGLGRMLGFAAAGFLKGFKTGMEEFELVAAAQDMDTQADTKEPDAMPQKTRIAECRLCWCDQCASLERCQKGREGMENGGNRYAASPCYGCGDGMRFMPCEEERCAAFIQSATPNNG